MQAGGGVDAGQQPAPAGAAAVALAAVAAAVDGLLATDLSLPGTSELLDLMREVERQSRRLAAASVAVIGQVDTRGLAAPTGCRSTAALVRQVITIGTDESARRARLAAGICPSTGLSGAAVPPRFPLVAAAVRSGGVGVREAALICSTIVGFPPHHDPAVVVAAEQFLVEQAAVLDPKTFKQTAREIALMANPDGTPDDRDAHEKMEFHLGGRGQDGLTRCWGLLDDLTAEALRAAFGSMCSPSAERHSDRQDAQQPEDPDDADGRGPTPADGVDWNSAHGVGPGPAESNADLAEGHPAEGADVAGQPFLPDPDATPAGPPTAGRPPDRPDPPDPGGPAARPGRSTGVAEDCPHNGLSPDRCDPVGPVWRAPRLPYDWAPLGSVPSDYLPAAADGAPLDGARLDDTRPNENSNDADVHRAVLDGSTPTAATPEPEPPPDRRSAGTKRAQALSVIVNHFLDAGVAPTQGGQRPHLIVTIDEQSLTGRTGAARLGYGDQLPAGQLRMLACDAKIIPAVLGGASEVLDVGRSLRTFSAACRTAILLRDVGCVFPGCGMPGRWADFHHIQHWADGGPSDLHNGCLLCKRHHTLIHQEQWQVRMGTDRLPEIIPPTSHDLEQRPLRNTQHRPPVFTWPQVG